MNNEPDNSAGPLASMPPAKAAAAEQEGALVQATPEGTVKQGARPIGFSDVLAELYEIQSDIENYKSFTSMGSARLRRIDILDKARSIIATTQANHVAAQSQKRDRR